MKKKLLSLLASLLLLPLASYADCDDKGACPMKGGRGGKNDCQKQEECSQCPIVGKFMKCSGFLLGNAAEIGLSDDQVKTIQSLRNDMMKQGIQAKAGMEIFMIDMNAKLCEDKVDVEGISKMIDEGTKAMADGGKGALQALAKLHDLVKPEQMKKCKELCKKGCKK